MADTITNMKELCEYFCADEPAGLNRRIYKDTACGASLSVCVRNPHDTQPDRIETVVKAGVYEKAKYPYKRLELEVWVDADEHPHDAHVVSVTRNGERVKDPGELAFYTKLYSIDDPTFFWGAVADVPHEKAVVAGDASRHGWTVHLKPYHDPLMIELPGLFIEELFVGDRKIEPYLGDHLREAYRDCQWFERWERQVMQGLHFSCGNDRAEFWPQDPEEARGREVTTLDDLRATASRSIEYDGRTKLVWDLRHHEAPESVVISAIIRRDGDGCVLTKIGHGDDDWIADPQMIPAGWKNTFCNEAWYESAVTFFSLDVGLSDVTLEKLREQDWEPSDEVQLDSDSDRDEIQLTKTFRASDKCYGWKTDRASQWVWVHNGNSLWRELTLETPIRAFTIQSIVEGSDATVDSDQFNIPCSTKEVDKWMEEMEEETSAIWDRDNHDWYYAFVDDQCVGQFKIGWDDDAFECFDPDHPPLTPREQAVVIRWLNRGEPTVTRGRMTCPSHEKTRVLTTRVWVERFYQEIW